jgi:tight adherence protein B
MALIVGVFRLLDIRFTDLFRDFINKPQSIRTQIDEATNRKKKRFIVRQIEEVSEIMRLTDREDKIPVVFIACAVFAIAGAIIASLFDNVFLIPVLGIGMMCLPVWYVKLTASHFKKDISEELETALSVISSAYIRNEDIVTAVEENVHYLNPPIKNVFTDFLVQLKLIDSDVVKAIEGLKPKIDNDVFHEWCDALIQCQSDRNLKSTLTPIVTKLSDVRTVNTELELMLAEPRKEFIIMAMLVVATIPILYFLNKDWYEVLMHTGIGKIVLAVDFAAIFICGAFVVKLTRPIEFRR